MFNFLDSEPNNILPIPNEPNLPTSTNRIEPSHVISMTAETSQIYVNEVASNTTTFANDFLWQPNLLKNSLITTNADTFIEDNLHQTTETRDLLTGNIPDSIVGEFDSLTDVARAQSKRQSRNATQSQGIGNSYREAFKIDDISYERYFNGFVSRYDNTDFYHLEVTEKGEMNIELSWLNDNADLYLRNSRGQVIKKSLNKSTANEEINTVLEADDYYVQVKTRKTNVNTAYDLKLNFTAFPTDNAGNNLRNALVVPAPQSYSDYVGLDDRQDFYTFTVDGGHYINIDISLTELSANADLYLLSEDGKNEISSSQNPGNADESISISTLAEPTTYYLLVKSSGASTDYNLEFDWRKISFTFGGKPVSQPQPQEPPPLLQGPPIKTNTNKPDRLEDIPTKFDKRSRLDLMVIYTPEAKEQQGGTRNIEELIQLAVNNTNKAFTNSGVKTKLRLVHTTEVDYQESGKSHLDLKRLQKTDEGYMDEVHQLRDKYGADIVSLFVDKLEVGKGTQIAGRSYFMGLPTYRFRENAFNVIRTDTAIQTHSLSHEIGHNLGLQEDIENSKSDPYYPYGHGYGVKGKFGTIMSYAYDYNAETINYFSNPNKTYGGTPLGTPESENAAKAINKVLKYAANWKPSVRRRKRR